MFCLFKEHFFKFKFVEQDEVKRDAVDVQFAATLSSQVKRMQARVPAFSM